MGEVSIVFARLGMHALFGLLRGIPSLAVRSGYTLGKMPFAKKRNVGFYEAIVLDNSSRDSVLAPTQRPKVPYAWMD